MPTTPNKDLETFDNPNPDRDYIIEIETPEFTCLCPKTGQPDFAHIYIEYVPDRKCVELKSLKLYFWSYRNEGAFHEAVTNTILNDLVAATAPRYMAVRARFYVRGGVYTTVEVEHQQPGWNPPPAPPDHLPRESRSLPTNEDMAAEVERMPSEASGPGVRSESRFRMLRRSRRTEAKMAAPGPAAGTPATPAETAPEPVAPIEPVRPLRPDPVYIGVDFGTTGCRAVGVDADGTILASAESPIPEPEGEDLEITQDPKEWWTALNVTLGNLLLDIDPKRVEAISVDGTSATVLLSDTQGNPLTPALMYNDGRAFEQAEQIAAVADAQSGAQGPGSSLAKLLWFRDQGLPAGSAHLLHQADWIAGRLCGRFGVSDENNALKLGYDIQKGEWPRWFDRLDVDPGLLPEVVAVGSELGTVSREAIKAFGIDENVRILAGTTDGVAAFLAAGANEPGQAVTSLGSTLVLKLLSDQPIFSAENGVYSHKLGRYWLAGGASNSGGAVLLQYFKPEQLTEMTPMLDPENPTGLNYYPLPSVGERFPSNNPDMVARLEPLPSDSVTFFQGILEGITAIEKQGYSLLAKLGAPKLRDVRATGSGSRNPAWARIRGKALGVKITKAVSDMPAYGAALIAAGKLARFE